MVGQQIFRPIKAALNVKNPVINKDSLENEKNHFLKNGLIKTD